MDNVKGKSGFGWIELVNVGTDPTDTESTRRGIAAVGTALKHWDGTSWVTLEAGSSSTHAMLSATHTDSTVGTVARGDIITGQGATAKWTRLAKGTEAQMLIMGANEPAWASLAGDVTVGSTGTTAITAGSIIDADINAAADIAVTKLALTTGSIILGTASKGAALDIKGDGKIIVGNGTTATSVAVTGDVTLANDGSTTVTGLTIASEAQGDILYRNATDWVRLAAGDSGKFLKTQGAGSNPTWDNPTVGYADALKTPFTIEGGTYDPSTTVTTQTSAAAALTIPDLAGVAQEWVFSKKAQTLEGKTLTSPTLTTPIIVTTGSITDAGGDPYLAFVENATPTDSIQITQGGTGEGAKIESVTTDTNANLILAGAGTGDVVIANGTDLTFDRATFDALIVVADQTGEAHTFNIPDIATGASDTFAFLAEAQTLSNKTLTAPKIVTTGYIADEGGDEYLVFTESATPVNYIGITSADTGAAPKVTAGGSDDNVSLHLHGKGTGDVILSDGTDSTKQVKFELNGATGSTATTVAVSQTEARTVTLPDATCTLIGKDTTDVLTNKSFDCDGTGNALTNVNATELDPIGNAAFGIPFVVQASFTNIAAAGSNIIGTHPKMRVIDAWVVHTSGDAGTACVHLGQVGALGDAITDVATLAAGDKDITRFGEIDDAKWDVAANAGLVLVGDGGASADGVVFVMCLRID